MRTKWCTFSLFEAFFYEDHSLIVNGDKWVTHQYSTYNTPGRCHVSLHIRGLRHRLKCNAIGYFVAYFDTIPILSVCDT